MPPRQPRWQKKDEWADKKPAAKGRGAKGRGYADGTGGTGIAALPPDVLKHAAAVRRSLTSKAADARRQEEEKAQTEYRNNLMHEVLKFLKANDGEGWMSTFFYEVHHSQREASQKKMVEFIEQYMEELVECYEDDTRNQGQYCMRMIMESESEEDDDEWEPAPKKGQRRTRQDGYSRDRAGSGKHQRRKVSAPTPPGNRMKVHVGNINWESEENDLQEYFEKCGDIYSVKIIYDKETGKCKGWAIVEIVSNKDAKQAIEELHDTIFDGRRIRVREFSEH